MSPPLRLAALALAVALAGCKSRAAPAEDRPAPPAASASSAAPAPSTLDARHEPLRSRFDGAAGSPRLLVLASPT